MGIRTRNELKDRFVSGQIPTEDMFSELIDSMLNKYDDDFYGKWKAGAQYYPGDVVIYGNSLYRVKSQSGSHGNDSGSPKRAESSQDPVCSSKSPPNDPDHWEMLEFDLEDDDWAYDTGELWAKDVHAKVGIGTEQPRAKLHVEKEDCGRMLFEPEASLNHCGGPDPNPELRIERGESNQGNYFSVRQNHEITHVETTAKQGFHFQYSASGSSPDLMACISPTGTGICTSDPKAVLDVLVEDRGEYEVFPHDNEEASVRLTSLKGSQEYWVEHKVDDLFATYLTSAPQGFKFKAQNQKDDKGGSHEKVVVIDENGHVAIGKDNPDCMLEVENLECGRALVSLEHTNPTVSVVNLRPNGSYLAMGAENTFAVFKTDADNGFVFKRGAIYGASEDDAPEKDLNGEPLVYIDKEGKVGIGDAPEQYELDLYGTSRSFEAYLNTNETTIREKGYIENAVETVCRLTAILFEWKNKGGVLSEREQYGLRPSDCQDFTPQVVKDCGKGDFAIAYQNLVPLLVKAIQELQADIDGLKSQLDDQD